MLVLVGVAGVLLGPWWLPIAAGIMLSLRWRAWEVLFLGLGMDLLWLPGASLFAHVPLYTLGALMLVWGLEPLRRRLLVE